MLRIGAVFAVESVCPSRSGIDVISKKLNDKVLIVLKCLQYVHDFNCQQVKLTYCSLKYI